MKKSILSVGILFLFATLFAFSTPLTAQPELSEGMSQGDFALWVVKAIGASDKLPPAANAEDAIEFLSKLGIVPEGGWEKGSAISNEILAELAGEPGAGGLSFDELVDKAQDHIQNTFNEKVLGVFRAQSSGTTSAPA